MAETVFPAHGEDYMLRPDGIDKLGNRRSLAAVMPGDQHRGRQLVRYALGHFQFADAFSIRGQQQALRALRNFQHTAFVVVAALGLGTAMVYPTLLAAIADVAAPSWRASAIGVYRLWRDLGFAVGAVVAGLAADEFGMRAAIGLVAALTAASGVVVLIRMRETHSIG